MTVVDPRWAVQGAAVEVLGGVAPPAVAERVVGVGACVSGGCISGVVVGDSDGARTHRARRGIQRHLIVRMGI